MRVFLCGEHGNFSWMSLIPLMMTSNVNRNMPHQYKAVVCVYIYIYKQS